MNRNASTQETLQALINDLEAHDGVFVDTAIHCGADRYTLQMRTPLGPRCGERTADQWRKLVRAEVHVAGTLECPFCLTNNDRGTLNRTCTCQLCGALTEVTPARLLEEVDPWAMSAGEALWVLTKFDQVVRADGTLGQLWIRLPAPLPSQSLLDPPGVAKLLVPDGSQSVDAPVLIDVRNLDPDTIADAEEATSVEMLEASLGPVARDRLVRPTCKHCVHAIFVSHPDGPSTTRCTRALQSKLSGPGIRIFLDTWLDPHEFGYKSERVAGRPVPEAIVWNAFVERVIAHLPDTSSFEGRYGEPFEGFGGPVCSAFEVSYTVEDDHDGELTVASLDTTVRFDVANLERHQRDRQLERHHALLQEARAILVELSLSRRYASLVGAMLTKDDLDGPLAKRLLKLVELKLPDELLDAGEVFLPLVGNFNFSIDVAEALDRRLREQRR